MPAPGVSAAVTPTPAIGRRLRICILARKNLEWNTRIFRQARALSEAGHEVTVVCLRPPHPRLAARAPGVRYFAVTPSPGLIDRAAKACGTVVDGLLNRPVRLLRRLGTGAARRLRREFAGAASNAWSLSHRLAPQPEGPPLRKYRRPSRRIAAWLRDRLAPHSSFLRDREFRTSVERVLAGETFDCIQAHDSHALAAARRLRDRCGAKLVYDAVEISTQRSGWTQANTPPWLIRLEDRVNARIIGTADLVVTVSDGLAAWLSRHYGLARPVIVRNCRYYADIERNDAIRRALGLNPDEQLVLYLNSVYEGQGLEQLIDALCHLPQSVHVATLGPLPRPRFVEALRARAAARGVDRRFHILQPKPADEMLSFAAGADIGVVPRQDTSFNNRISLPNRIFELVMARLPIAAPSLPDMKAFVAEYGLGLSFDETDPRDIARAVQEMLVPANLGRFRQAVDRAAGVLCWENESPRYVASLESLFEASPSATGSPPRRAQGECNNSSGKRAAAS